MLMLSLLLALLPNERPTIDVSSYVLDTECVQRGSYGGRNEVLCDLAPALNRALLECYEDAGTWVGTVDVGCKLVVPRGLFYIGSTVEFCHRGSIEFQGGKVFSAPNVTPFNFVGFQRCRDSNLPSAGPWEVDELYMRPYGVTSTVTDAFGIEAHSPVRLRDVHLMAYTQGVHIHANATADEVAARANANGYSLENVTVQTSLHAGIHVDGPDVNVGVGVRVGSTSNCKQANNLVARLGPCADIFDGSFLGDTWVAASTGYAQDALGAVYPGIVLGDSANSRSVCVGCYIEGGYGGGQVAAVANVVGGIGGWSGPGNRLEGNRISALEATSPDGLLRVRLGANTGGGAFSLVPVGSGTYPLRWKYEATTGAVRLDVGNLNSAVVYRVGATSSALGGLGGYVLRPTSGLLNVYLNNANNIISRQAP